MISRLNQTLARWARVFYLAVATVGVCACANEPDHPAAPPDKPSVQTAVVAPHAHVVPEMFEDAVSRILPSFTDESRASELRTSLDNFSLAYAAGNDAAARSALMSARSLLDKGGAHAANLSALRLSIARAEALMDSTMTSEVSHD